MRLVRTLVVAGATAATIGTVSSTILPSANNTTAKVEARQQHAWAEYEKQRLQEENRKLARSAETSEGSGAADSAGDAGGADANEGVAAAADRGGADDAAEGLVDVFLRH